MAKPRCVVQIDEFLATGTLAGIDEDGTQKEEKSKNTDMALKFI